MNLDPIPAARAPPQQAAFDWTPALPNVTRKISLRTRHPCPLVALVIDVLVLAKVLCFDMEADKHDDDNQLVEVRLLVLVERLEPMGLGR
jgi:hypothetical protein